MNAIIYTTETGSTERYAKLLAHETGLPVCSLAEAKKKVPAGAGIIYLGWIMAGNIKGYAGAATCRLRRGHGSNRLANGRCTPKNSHSGKHPGLHPARQF